ncbi:MAG: GGDEF domain-containing protein [Bdellovibrionales bacterium]|nr:GGDEF domain-containing protein [Massilia sp.]
MKPDQLLASLSRLDHQKRSVTLVAIIFFSLVCLSLGGMQAWSVYRARDIQLHSATLAAANMTRSLADHVSSAIDLGDTILAELADRIERSADAGSSGTLAPYAGERIRRTPLLGELSVYDAAGALAFTSRAVRSGSLEASSQTAFHAGAAGAALLIAAPVRGPGNGEWLMPLSRRLLNADGSYAGIALATIRLSLLSQFHADFDLGPGGSLMVALDTGPLLMARFEHDGGIGKDVRATAALRAASRQAGSGAGASILRAADVAGAGAGDALYSYRHLNAYPILVTVSRPTDDILAEWWESAYLSTAGVSLLMLIQLWLGVRLYAQITLRDQLEKERRSLQKMLVKKSRSLRRQALKDALTGIANRRLFDTRLAREYSRAAAEASPLALVILDVDYFKKYNDEYGHPAGDECLKFIASCVNGGRRRSEDLAARLGGEEFAILLPNTGLRGAIAVAEAIRKRIASHKLTHVAGRAHTVTVSCGVHALVPTRGMAPSELIAAADKALYLAKSSGRNRVRAEGAMPESRAQRFKLVVNQ